MQVGRVQVTPESTYVCDRIENDIKPVGDNNTHQKYVQITSNFPSSDCNAMFSDFSTNIFQIFFSDHHVSIFRICRVPPFLDTYYSVSDIITPYFPDITIINTVCLQSTDTVPLTVLSRA